LFDIRIKQISPTNIQQLKPHKKWGREDFLIGVRTLWQRASLFELRPYPIWITKVIKILGFSPRVNPIAQLLQNHFARWLYATIWCSFV